MRILFGKIKECLLDVVTNHALIYIAYLTFPDTSPRDKNEKECEVLEPSLKFLSVISLPSTEKQIYFPQLIKASSKDFML